MNYEHDELEQARGNVIQLRAKTIELPAKQIDAINETMAVTQYDLDDAVFRNEQLAREIAHLRRVIDTMRQYCISAKEMCMLLRNTQAMCLNRAIEVADMAVPR